MWCFFCSVEVFFDRLQSTTGVVERERAAVSWQYFVTWQYLLGRAEECRQRFCYGCPSSERSHGPAHGELDRENVCGTSWLSASFEGHLCTVFALLSALGLFLGNGGSGGCG